MNSQVGWPILVGHYTALMVGGQFFWAVGNILLNLLGSLLITAVAIGVVNWLAPPLAA